MTKHSHTGITIPAAPGEMLAAGAERLAKWALGGRLIPSRRTRLVRVLHAFNCKKHK